MFVVSDHVSSDDIARVEARIEELSESVERCRKIALAAKLTVIAGAALTGLTLFWVVDFTPSLFIAGLAAMIGGAVLLGSNKTTWQQMQDALQASEALRAEMIGRLQLRTVGGNGRGDG